MDKLSQGQLFAGLVSTLVFGEFIIESTIKVLEVVCLYFAA